MSLVSTAAGATYAHADPLADFDAADLGDLAPHEYAYLNINGDADMDADMDNKPNSDEHSHSYVDRHGERVTYRHVHIFPAVKHANPDPSANLDADDYRDLDANSDLHQGATLPTRDKLEHQGWPL